MRRGRAMPNNTGIKGTWDGGVKKGVDRTSDEEKKKALKQLKWRVDEEDESRGDSERGTEGEARRV